MIDYILKADISFISDDLKSEKTSFDISVTDACLRYSSFNLQIRFFLKNLKSNFWLYYLLSFFGQFWHEMHTEGVMQYF